MKRKFMICICVLSRALWNRQEPPPGTDLHEGSYCWKCKGSGYLFYFLVIVIIHREVKGKRVICSVCNGIKIILSTKRRNVFDKPGRIMPERRY